MMITLSPGQQAWLEAQVASGALPSIEDGLRAAVSDLMAISEDDLAWAKPLAEEARQSLSSGQFRAGEDFLDRLDRRIGVLKGE